MLLLLGQLARAGRSPRRASSSSPSSASASTSSGATGNDAGLVDALALRVLPDRAQALGGPRRLVREQRRRSRAPAAPRARPSGRPSPRRRRSPRPPTAPPRPARPRPAASSARQRSYIGKISSSPVGGLGPLVEQRAPPRPSSPARSSSSHRCSRCSAYDDRLAALVGERQQAGSASPAPGDLAAPDEPLAGDPLGRLGDVEGGVGRRVGSARTGRRPGGRSGCAPRPAG